MGVKPACGSTRSGSSEGGTVLAGGVGAVLVVEPTDDFILVLGAVAVLVVVEVLCVGVVEQAAAIIDIQTNVPTRVGRLNVIDTPCNTTDHAIRHDRVPTPNSGAQTVGLSSRGHLAPSARPRGNVPRLTGELLRIQTASGAGSDTRVSSDRADAKSPFAPLARHLRPNCGTNPKWRTKTISSWVTWEPERSAGGIAALRRGRWLPGLSTFSEPPMSRARRRSSHFMRTTGSSRSLLNRTGT